MDSIQLLPKSPELLTGVSQCDSLTDECPAGDMLRLISGKWKPQILRIASKAAIRFNSLLRKIPGSNKQSLSVALKELEEAAILQKNVVSVKPRHIEYTLTPKGRAMLPIFTLAAAVAISKKS